MQSGVGQLSYLLRALLLLLICTGPAQAKPTLQLSSDGTWSLPGDWFGGFSGIELNATGTRATVITDKGDLARIALIRTDGKITGIQLLDQIPLRFANGSKLRGPYTDAEGLAETATGAFYISFEQHHRVALMNPKTGVTEPLPKATTFAAFGSNAGLEALAIHPNGTLYTLPERSPTARAMFELHAYDARGWRITHRIPRRGPFLPVGADFDRDGLLYLLERTVSPLGFRSRIRRFNLDADRLSEEILLTTAPGHFDNLEALSVWHDATGATRLTMISDDNFMRILRTQIVEYILNE